MAPFLKNISIICIYLQKENGEKVHETALYQPLEKNSSFNETHKLLTTRKKKELPLFRKIVLNLQTFAIKRFPQFIPESRKNPEAKFKTVLSLLLSQEALLHFFLDDADQRENFFQILEQTAKLFGDHSFLRPPEHMTPFEMAQFLTTLDTKSLLDDPVEFNLQIASLSRFERDEMLFSILNHIQRKPLTSVVEAFSENDESWKIAITTKYGKYKITNIEKGGHIHYSFKENESKVCIPIKEPLNGIVNQHMIFDTTNASLFIGSVCGHLKTEYHVLEQILFLLNIQGDVSIQERPDCNEEKTFLFTSLFSWNEFEKIQNEHNAIEALEGKTLVYQGRVIRLKLLYQNVAFNAFNKFPTPSEIKASINDLNDVGLLQLSYLTLKALDIDFPPLQKIICDHKKESDFLKKQQLLLNEVDTFRSFQKFLVASLEHYLAKHHDPSKRTMALSLKTLLLKKLAHGKPWHEIDHLIYLSLLTSHLNIIHNKNCEHATDRSAGAISIDKAQNAFQKMTNVAYLPGISTKREKALFKVLYSMYLVFEEPELNAGLCTGFIGEKFYGNFIQKNPETTHYLTPWLQKHPETYLGLSEYRF